MKCPVFRDVMPRRNLVTFRRDVMSLKVKTEGVQEHNVLYDPRQEHKVMYDPRQEHNVLYDPRKEHNILYDPRQEGSTVCL